MDEKELQEFDLDDIIKEFSDPENNTEEPVEEAEASEESPDATVPLPEIPAEEPKKTEVAEKEQKSPPADEDLSAKTQRFSVTDQTIRLDVIPDTIGTVHNAKPLDEEPEEPAPSQEKTEPYSSAWEPEYEQPISEYVPPPPIIFRPRSRLRELKRKLVAGPERLYYELSEKGLGKLQAAIFLSMLVVLISALATAMYAFGMVQENRLRLMIFGQFLAMLVSALLGSNQLLSGAGALLRGKFTLNTLLLFTFIACCIDGVLCLQQLRVPCCAAFSLEVTMSLWGTYQHRNTQLGQFDTMRKAIRLDSIRIEPDYYHGLKGLLRGEGQVEDFMDSYNATSTPEKVLNIYALAAFVLSIGIGIAAGVLHNASFGIQAAAVSMLAAMPATIFITVTRPMAILERRLHSLGTVLCGWQGVKGLCRKAAFPLSHEDLFPAGSIKMNGVKFYSDREPDETVAYAAALIEADGGGLVPLFIQLLESRNGLHYPVENLRAYDGGGIGGEVNSEPVLVGSLSFLKQMGVETPEGIRLSQAVCVAVDGELCGVFAVTYDKLRDASAGLSNLCAYRGVNPTLVTNDFMLTPGFIRSKFGVNAKRILFPEHDDRGTLREKEPKIDAKALLLVTKSGLTPFAYGVTGARSLRTACIAGVVLHMLGGIVGMGMMLILAVLGASGLLTPGNLFLYELIWIIPGLMITEWTRTI